MMQRIGFRRLLPFVFTVMHVALLLYGTERQHQTRAFGALQQRYVPAVYQENGVRWDVIEPKPLTTAQKLGLLLNLPSLLLAIPLAATLFHGSDMGLLYAALPFVPLVWYAIGRWLDGLLGYSARLCLPRILRGFLAVPAGLVLCVSLACFTPLYHHRTADTYWMFSALVLWSGLCLTMMTASARRLGD